MCSMQEWQRMHLISQRFLDFIWDLCQNFLLRAQGETEVDTRLSDELQTALYESSKISTSLQSKLNINFARLILSVDAILL